MNYLPDVKGVDKIGLQPNISRNSVVSSAVKQVSWSEVILDGMPTLEKNIYQSLTNGFSCGRPQWICERVSRMGVDQTQTIFVFAMLKQRTNDIHVQMRNGTGSLGMT